MPRSKCCERCRYVSRGGLKLEAALEHFDIDVAGKVCSDVGSSTGGFTDCLLQHGAARVYAIDVGTGQLDWKLRNDPRVVVREGVNARYLNAADFPEPVRPGRVRCQLHLGHDDSARAAAPLLRRKWRNGDPGQAAIRAGTRTGGQRRNRARSGAASRRLCAGQRVRSRRWDSSTRSPRVRFSARKATEVPLICPPLKPPGFISKPRSEPAARIVPELIRWLDQHGGRPAWIWKPRVTAIPEGPVSRAIKCPTARNC